MAKAKSFIPDGYNTITPYLIVDDAKRALEVYSKALGAHELFRMDDPKTGKIGHAEMKIGNSVFMVADEHPEMGARSPKSVGGSPMSLMIYVEDVDMVGKNALAAGMTAVRPIQDQFYGDRSGTFKDPFGYSWNIATHIEDLTPEEMEERAKKAFAG